MLPAIAVALAWAPALVGLGALAPWRGDADVRPGVAGLLGLVYAGVIGAALNFAIPLGPAVSIGVWIVGMGALALRRRWLAEAFRPTDLLVAVAVVAVATWLMREPFFQYDTSFYHRQAIAWMKVDRLVPGIANVHHRLGYNSLWLTAAAVVDLPFADWKSSLFLNQLPMAFAALVAAVGLRALVRGDRSFPSLMLAGTVLPIASATFGIGGLYVDYTAAMYVYVALALWARALETADGFAARWAAPALLSFSAPLLKLSALPIAGAAAAVLLVGRATLSRRSLALLGGFVAATWVPWLARGLATSGCLAFPAPSSCIARIPWTVPDAKTREVAAGIVSFARSGVPMRGATGWFVPWWGRVALDYPEWYLLLAVAVAGTVAWLLLRRRASRAAWFVLAASLAGIVYWFLTVPDPRFALGFLFAFALAPAFDVVAGWSEGVAMRPAGPAAAAALVLAAVALAAALDGHKRMGTVMNDLPPWRAPLLEWPVPPEFEVERVFTRSGDAVFVPVRGELCGAAFLPCAPAGDFSPDLRYDGYFHVGSKP